MKSCLIVDDSRVVRQVIRRIVERFGFECSEAENAKDAYEQCKINMPEAIIVDQIMPDMTGLEFLEKLHEIKTDTLPKIIFCTADSDVKTIQIALEKGADEYIMKPFDREIMQSKFRILGLI